ncbi:phosphotransferase family protein [Mycolicibacterium neoaurum]|uniref:phosphotransferase family protein n=1 Tax=Mycolicibacterium neoaurum TaxID=1795 RepID=UPI001BD13D2C|nr:phosphotransferase family protein [Mycolicibacterium neoaurum]QVI27333.1 phosphotransferase family protein [Mycolicibacterium neoaurum]
MSDHTLNLAQLQALLVNNGIALSGSLSAQLLAGGRSNLTYRVTDGSSVWVVRRPPARGLTPSAHDVAREYRVMRALQGTAVPVAATIACDVNGSYTGAPITVAEFVAGRVIRANTDLDDLNDDQIEALTSELIHTLVDLHEVDYRAVGLDDFGRPDGFLARQVTLWTKQWRRVRTRDLADLDRLATALADRVPATTPRPAIVHGDFRVDNTIVDLSGPRLVRAVVDWELSTIGDPMTDVALMCVYRSAALDTILGTHAAWTSPRLPSPDTLAQHYALASGTDLNHWSFYVALAHFKLAVIAEGIAFRADAGASAGDGAAAAAACVPELVSVGLSTLRRSGATSTS